MIASLNAQRQMREFSRRRIYTRLRRQGPGLDRDGEETYYETRRDDYASERNFVAAMRETRREIRMEMKRSLNSARSIALLITYRVTSGFLPRRCRPLALMTNLE